MIALLRIRSDVKDHPGGDYIHLLKTREALERLGVSCLISPGLEPMPTRVDVVHLFNTTRIHETYLQFRKAEERGIPAVLTPIWHSIAEMKRFYQKSYGIPWFPIWSYLALKEFLYARRSPLPMFWPATFRFKELQREVIRGCTAVLPNSRAELRILCEELGVKPQASFIIPPGTEAMDRTGSPAKERRDVLCVGRIEPRKNQLEVARAFRARPRGKNRLLFYGSLNNSHPRYWKKVKDQLRDGEVEYRGAVPQKEIFAAYAKAKGAILASFFETCGLAAMEAISCGARACVSDTPYMREFYQDAVTYCDPFSTESIAHGIDALLSEPHIAPAVHPSDCSWDEVAQKTMQAYEHALASKTSYARVA